MATGVTIEATPEQLAAVTFNADGLVAAIAQDVATKEILMMAWMNAESLQMTLAEGRMVYWSRSRQELWRKGDTSGDRQFVREAYYDCDADTLLFKVQQLGNGACHTGERTCFHRRFGEPSESSSERAIRRRGEPSESSSERATQRRGEPSESSSERAIRRGAD